MLIKDATKRIQSMDSIDPIKFTIREGDLGMDVDGVGAQLTSDLGSEIAEGIRRVPDVLSELSRRLPISRATLAEILENCGRFDEVKVNPSAFLDQVAVEINLALQKQLADCIEYTPLSGERWEAQQFVDHVGTAYEGNLVEVKKSITKHVPVDSDVEREFATAMDGREDVKLFLKLPSWFKIPTPLGGYNADWAIVREEEAGTYLYSRERDKRGQSHSRTSGSSMRSSRSSSALRTSVPSRSTTSSGGTPISCSSPAPPTKGTDLASHAPRRLRSPRFRSSRAKRRTLSPTGAGTCRSSPRPARARPRWSLSGCGLLAEGEDPSRSSRSRSPRRRPPSSRSASASA